MNGVTSGNRLFARADCEAVFDKVVGMTNGEGDTLVAIEGIWYGSLRWAMNRLISSGDTRNHIVHIRRKVRGAWGAATTNQIDHRSLESTLRDAERSTLWSDEDHNAPDMLPGQQYARPKLFAESSFQLLAPERSKVARHLVGIISDQGLTSAGYIETAAFSRSVYNTQGMAQYYTGTSSQYSVTVRDPRRNGSGWAGKDHSDWDSIEAENLTRLAIEKCKLSASPRAVEPGRYTVILEPQAVHQLMTVAISALSVRSRSERLSLDPYFAGRRDGWPVEFSKIGLKVVDERITVTTDPAALQAPYLPFDIGMGLEEGGEPYGKVTWIENGVLREIAHSREYAVTELHRRLPITHTKSFEMSGGGMSVEDMIQTTRRGILVTRFSGMKVINPSSLHCLGVTRDGLWLLEHGRISLPVKNMRFLESPFFAFNNLEQLGSQVRVYSPSAPAIIPSAKVRDFTFVSLADAV